MALNKAQRPQLRGVRVALGTGYSRVRVIRRARRNGGVSSCLPPESPIRPIRSSFTARSPKSRPGAHVVVRTQALQPLAYIEQQPVVVEEELHRRQAALQRVRAPSEHLNVADAVVALGGSVVGLAHRCASSPAPHAVSTTQPRTGVGWLRAPQPRTFELSLPLLFHQVSCRVRCVCPLPHVGEWLVSTEREGLSLLFEGFETELGGQQGSQVARWYCVCGARSYAALEPPAQQTLASAGSLSMRQLEVRVRRCAATLRRMFGPAGVLTRPAWARSWFGMMAARNVSTRFCSLCNTHGACTTAVLVHAPEQPRTGYRRRRRRRSAGAAAATQRTLSSPRGRWRREGRTTRPVDHGC